MSELKKYVDKRLRELGLSRKELVQELGYRNVSKGLRRIDHYVLTLSGPPETAVALEELLDGGDGRYQAALALTNKMLEKEREASFRPSIRIKFKGGRPSFPLFVAAFVYQSTQVRIDEDLSHLPFDQEIGRVCELYRDHKLLEDGAWAGNGFVYSRTYRERYVFNKDCYLKEVETDAGLPGGAWLSVGGKRFDGASLRV